MHTSSRCFQKIPVIDVQPLLKPQDAAAKLRVAAELHAACRDVGFFYVKNHGVQEKLLRDVLSEAKQWFLLPEQMKRQVELSESTRFRGYQPLGANVTRYDGGFSRDWHEGIDLYREGRAGCSEETAVHGSNPQLSQMPGFAQTLNDYIDACLRLGQLLMRGIALGLGLDERFFEETCNGGTTHESSFWVTRVLHYPPLSQGDAHQPDLAERAAKGEEAQRSVQLSCGEHTDYGLLTLVNQEADVTALQVKNAAGQWIDATPIPGTLVCNLGDMLKVYTNGLYTPTTHRVINADLSRSRISIPFFYETAFSSVVRPIPQLVGSAQQPKFEPVVYGDHLLSKVLSNFELEAAEKPCVAAA